MQVKIQPGLHQRSKFRVDYINSVKESKSWVWNSGLAQKVRVLAALPEDLGYITRIYMAATAGVCSSTFRHLMSLLALVGTSCMDRHMEQTKHMYT